MKTLKTEYLIIGNSASGAASIEGIRKIDKTGSITVISDENTFNYSRPLISYFLAGKVKKRAMLFRDKKFYSRNNVKLILGNMAEKLDTKKRIAYLSQEKKIVFNKLLIAMGGSPIVPEIKGRELERV